MEEDDNGLIDFSSENDNLILSDSSSTLTSALADLNSSETIEDAKSFQLLEDVNNENEVSHTQANGQIEELPQLLETAEPERKQKYGKCNMRKSLAWDSAFFTSSGVLDAEELTNMIEGTEKSKKHVLSRIEEDICRSTDSISTLGSENLTLESLEAELFQDIRASIQRSGKALNTENSCSKVASQESDTHVPPSSNRVDPGSRSRLKPKPTSKAPSRLQRSEKASKPGSGSETIQTVTRIRDSTSALPRPPMPINWPHNPNRLSTSTTKRASLSANRIKIESEDTKTTNGRSKGVQPSKPASLTGPRRAVPKPLPPSKLSSSLGSSATAKTNLSRTTSAGSSTSASSNNSLKLPARKKTDPASQTSSKIPSRIKKQPEKPTLSAHLKLTSLSSSISPASSISEWSSESSSSASTANRRSISRASIETNSSCRSIKSDTPALRVNVKTNLPSHNVKKGPGPSMKPSGLRMPSPKIGFFDGAKSASRTPNGGLPKVRSSISSPVGVSSNKSKLGTAQKSASPSSPSIKDSSSSKGVKGQSKTRENGTGEIVKDQESVGSMSSCSKVSCIDTGAKQQAVESQKDERIAKRTPFTENNTISRESSVDVVEKVAAVRSNETGLKENS